nr:hypothetical protein [Cyanobium usitatum]
MVLPENHHLAPGGMEHLHRLAFLDDVAGVILHRVFGVFLWLCIAELLLLRSGERERNLEAVWVGVSMDLPRLSCPRVAVVIQQPLQRGNPIDIEDEQAVTRSDTTTNRGSGFRYLLSFERCLLPPT